MRVFGFDITRTKLIAPNLSNVDTHRGGWWPIINESFSGAFQSNVTVRLENVLTFSAVYACVTLIANDISKLGLCLVEQDSDGTWHETFSPAFSPVLRKPNHYQTRIEFVRSWMTSKLTQGNAYMLKERDQRQVVTALYVLDPLRVKPLIADNGDVYYEVLRDLISGVQTERIVVPQSEIIHDKMCPLYHPLVGISPITACGIAAIQGLKIQENSALFFESGSNPGGIVTVPGSISQATAQALKTAWETNYSGANAGRVAVLGDGMKYEPLKIVSPVDAELIDQLKMTAETACQAFSVPPYKVNVGPPPSFNNVEALDQQYYSQCLQAHLENIELLLDEGLGLVNGGEIQRLGVEFEVDDLLRMDTSTLMKAAADGVNSGTMSPNEARMRFHGLPPVEGGDTPYLQQQYWPLSQLAEREIPGTTPTPQPTPPAEDAPDLPEVDDTPEDAADAADAGEPPDTASVRGFDMGLFLRHFTNELQHG
jgi:HK97 family phage portal protein